MSAISESIRESLPPGRASFSIKEVCEITGLSRTSIYEAVSDGQLKTRKFGRRTLVLVSDLARWLAGLAGGGV